MANPHPKTIPTSPPAPRKAYQKGPTRKGVVSDVVMQQKALDMRVAGMQYKEISEKLGISNYTAIDLVRRCLNDVIAHTRETAAQLKAMDDMCLQRAKLALMAKIEKERKSASSKSSAALATLSNSLSRIVETRARLHGTFAPVKIEGSVDVNAVGNIRVDYTRLTADELRVLAELVERSTVRVEENQGGTGPALLPGVCESGVGDGSPLN